MGLEILVDTTRGFRESPKKLARAQHEVAFKLAKFVSLTMRNALLKNEFSLPPKSKNWEARSGSKTPLVNTMRYVRGIKAVRHTDGKTAGIRGDWVLAKLHEGGTKTMPARPHIRPSLNRLNEQLGDVIGEGFIKELFNE
jgi:hypothetical protein